MAEHSGSMIAFVPELPDELTVLGGEPVDELHVTLVYLTDDHTTLSAEHRAAIGSVIREHAVAIEAPIVGVRTLGDNEPPATVLLLDSPELQALRSAIKQAMADAGVPVPEDRFPTYIPHLTVGYGTPLDDAGHLVGKRVTLATLAAFYGPDQDAVYRNELLREESSMTSWTSVLARLGMPTGDGRIIAPGSLTNRSLPLPLSWQRTNEEGHSGSVVVARIETIDFAADMVTATGTMLDVPEADEAQRLIEAGVIGPSVDLDDMTFIVDDNDQMIITEARIAGATLVSIPAFADVSITMQSTLPDNTDEPAPMLVASAAPVPAVGMFTNPMLSGPTPLTATSDNRVFGHITTWQTCHIGLPDCTTAPSSPSGYAYFLTHEQATDAGTIPVGVLTVGGGHAAPNLGFVAATQHYDDVAAAVAHVNIGEDEHGIWVAGQILPHADPVKVEQFRTSPISGDWRRIGGALEMIAACSVNTPGFPIPRARAHASLSLGKARSLVMALGQPVSGEKEDMAPDQAFPANTEEAKAKWAWTNRKGR